MNWVVRFESMKQQAIADDMQKISLLLEQYIVEEPASHVIDPTVCMFIEALKHRIHDRVIQNQVHYVKRYHLGVLPRSVYKTWLEHAGHVRTSHRGRPTREKRGNFGTDKIIHHRFNKMELNTVPCFGQNWWKFEFQEPGLGGRRLGFAIQYITFSYNIDTEFLDCTFGYDVYVNYLDHWVPAC
jgi:hypothetical protein